MKFIVGKKIGMTEVFDGVGNVTPVTLIEAGPCYVVQVKTIEKDGYAAVQLGYDQAKRLKKATEGHLKNVGKKLRYFREKRLMEAPKEDLKAKDEITVSNFSIGDKVKVTAVSKGKGFAGTIKRHNFHRGPKTHGSRNYRQPGSIGAAYPEHVMKGKAMPGALGNKKTTIKNLEVIALDEAQGVIAIKGAVPGPKKGLVVVEGI